MFLHAQIVGAMAEQIDEDGDVPMTDRRFLKVFYFFSPTRRSFLRMQYAHVPLS